MIYYAPSKSDKQSSNVNIKLSPMSKFIMDVTCDAIVEGKNIVVEFPSTFSFFSLLISNQYSFLTKKSTLIFTKNERISKLNDVYYHLMNDAVPFHVQVPIGIKTDNCIKLKETFITNIPANLKNKFITKMQDDIKNEEKPLVVLVSNDELIKNIEGSTIEMSKKYGKGLAIFENVNTKNQHHMKKIIEWCEHENVQFVFLTNFASPQFYEFIEAKENTVVIPFHSGQLSSNSLIQKTLSSYHSEDYYSRYKSFLDLFNIDREYNYKSKTNIEVDVINNGNNFLSLLKDIRVCISKLDNVDIDLKREILSLSKTAYESIDSFSTTDYLFKYSAHSNSRVNGVGLCNNIIAMSSLYEQNIQFLCSSITGSFWSIRNMIEKCQSPIYDNGYNKNNKFSRLFQIIAEYAESDFPLFIVTSNNREKKYLSTILNEHHPKMKDRLIVACPGNIDENQVSTGILILSGRLEYDQLSVLNLPFNKKIVLTYANEDENIVRNLIDMYEHINDYRKRLFTKSIHKMNNEVNISINYYTKYEFLNFFDNDTEETKNLDIINIDDYLKSLQSNFSKNYPVLSEYYETKSYMDELSKKIDDYSENENECAISSQQDHYIITLENVETGAEEKIISDTKSEHTFIDNGELKESVFTTASEKMVVIKTPGKTKSLLDILIELYDFDNHIDKTIIELWEDGLRSFENTLQNLTELYSEYREHGGQKEKQTVRTWLNRKTLGPQDKKDIEIMGTVLSIEESKNESDYIFKELKKIRTMKQSLGRRLSKIITIFFNKCEIADDPNSAIIWEEIKNYLFIVKKVTFVPRQNTVNLDQRF